MKKQESTVEYEYFLFSIESNIFFIVIGQIFIFIGELF